MKWIILLSNSTETLLKEHDRLTSELVSSGMTTRQYVFPETERAFFQGKWIDVPSSTNDIISFMRLMMASYNENADKEMTIVVSTQSNVVMMCYQLEVLRGNIALDEIEILWLDSPSHQPRMRRDGAIDNAPPGMFFHGMDLLEQLIEERCNYYESLSHQK